MENVRNLSTHDNGNTWNVISSKIDELGIIRIQRPLFLTRTTFQYSAE
jgi:site-specific DNA-cytosine methylase